MSDSPTEAELAMARMEVWMRPVRAQIPDVNTPEQLAGYVKGIVACAICLACGARGLTFDEIQPGLPSMCDEVGERLFQVVERAWNLRN